MLHPDLKINASPDFGDQITDENELDELLKEDHISLTIGDIALEVEFSPAKAAFIGWVDEYNDDVFYYDNGSGNSEPVELIYNYCPEERMMCYDKNIIKDIVYYFCETGERNPKYAWIEDMR